MSFKELGSQPSSGSRSWLSKASILASGGPRSCDGGGGGRGGA
jgi:hypothetical protein